MRDSLTYFDLNDLKACLVSNAKQLVDMLFTRATEAFIYMYRA